MANFIRILLDHKNISLLCFTLFHKFLIKVNKILKVIRELRDFISRTQKRNVALSVFFMIDEEVSAFWLSDKSCTKPPQGHVQVAFWQVESTGNPPPGCQTDGGGMK